MKDPALAALDAATAQIKSPEKQRERAESEALKAKYEGYHNKKTRAGRKIHIPKKTILEFDEAPFIVTAYSRAHIVCLGKVKGLTIGREVHLFDGRFKVATSTPQDKKGVRTYRVTLEPMEGTVINTTPLKK